MSDNDKDAHPDWEALQQAFSTLNETVYELSSSKLGVSTYNQTQARILAAQELLALLEEPSIISATPSDTDSEKET